MEPQSKVFLKSEKVYNLMYDCDAQADNLEWKRAVRQHIHAKRDSVSVHRSLAIVGSILSQL